MTFDLDRGWFSRMKGLSSFDLARLVIECLTVAFEALGRVVELEVPEIFCSEVMAAQEGQWTCVSYVLRRSG